MTPEELQAELERLKQENEKLKSINAEIIESRQKAKEEKRKLAEEQGKYKQLYETVTAETTAKISELEKQLNELMPYKDKYAEVETERKREILERIPEKLRADAEANFTDLKQLKFYADSVSGLTPKYDDGKSGKTRNSIVGKTFRQLTMEEKKLLFQNKEEWNKYSVNQDLIIT